MTFLLVMHIFEKKQGAMLKKGQVSRRNFLIKSGMGAGFAGLGFTAPEIFSERTHPADSSFTPDKISPREVWVMEYG